MRFAESGYYIEKYVKCENCGVLVYDEGLTRDGAPSETVYCSEWCVAWHAAREGGEASPRIDLPFHS